MYQTHKLATTPLYLNSDITILDYIFLEFRKFVSHPSYAKTTVSETFRSDGLFKLPKPNACPKDFAAAKHSIKDFLVPLLTYDVCPQDCIIYSGMYSECIICPKCGESRYKQKKAAKTFKYLPLTARIARLYQTENLAKLLQAHGVRDDNGFLSDILDTDHWKKEWFGANGEFNSDTGCVLNFCTDGVNPFKTMHLTYSMWPLMVSILNFPVSFRKSVGGILVLGIIPGNGRKEAYHLDPYIGIVVEELLVLAECHIYYPSYMSAPIQIQAKLLQYVLDFPGISKLLQLPSTGAIKGCPWCGIVGKYSKAYRKTIYLDNRRYLKDVCVLRDNSNFVGDRNELRCAPAALTEIEIKDGRLKYDTLPNTNQKKKFAKENGVKGSYALMKLPYHRYHHHVQPDGMHTVCDFMEHILTWLTGKKSEEILQTGEAEFRPGKRKREETIAVLSDQEKSLGNERCANLTFPSSYSGYKGDIFNSPKIVLKKTHGWTEVCVYIIYFTVSYSYVNV